MEKRDGLRKLIHKSRKKKSLKLLFRYHYKKLTILVLSIILAYYIFNIPEITSLVGDLSKTNYIGVFIAGIFLAFGPTAPFAAGFFITYEAESILIASIIAGLGSLLADMFLFRFIRASFLDEFQELEKTKVIKIIQKNFHSKPFHKLKTYLFYSIIGILIASPLPDEIGLSMIAGLTHIKAKPLAVISFILHAIGTAVLLLI